MVVLNVCHSSSHDYSCTYHAYSHLAFFMLARRRSWFLLTVMRRGAATGVHAERGHGKKRRAVYERTLRSILLWSFFVMASHFLKVYTKGLTS